MTTLTAQPTAGIPMAPTAVKNVAVDLTHELDDGEVLTGTPTVAVSPSGPTLSAAAVTSTIRKVNGVTVEAGRCATFTITTSGATPGTYVVTLSVATSGGQSFPVYLVIVVSAS